MRKFLFTLLFAAVSIGAIAQESKQLININQESFRPEQQGVLEKVNIDPIAKDRSQRECARIKLHVNRMTREEIDQLQVHIAGGMVALTKKETSYEGNGLILEMTAKPGTRFHIHHDKYGDSNQVTVNLEGNKVYLLDAQLDLLLSVAVASNIKGADVYIDDTYKGVTGENYMLTVKDITPGEHKITIKQGAAVAEQMVNVNSDNISFRVEVNTVTSRPQYVVFNVKPQNAMVFIDNKPITTNTSGIATIVLQNGTYAWRVMANGYHEQSGTFTVSGAKVVKSVELVADAAMVTISAGEGAEIWVNNELKGKSPWRGQLLSGTYIFEARREGHRTTILSQTITSERAEQSYTLEVPTPIIGTVNVTSEPAMADVFVDGKNIGQTPLFADLLVGEHEIEIRCKDYATASQKITVAEGKTASVNITLSKAPSKYKVGDYYNDGTREGVVFWVDESGKHGKIVSLTEALGKLMWSSDTNEQKRLIGADDEYNGANNMAKVKQISGWESKYPAFKWCSDLGEGWYLPAIEELKLFTVNRSVYDAVNQTLASKGKKLANIGDSHSYWSSTEYNYLFTSGEFCARLVYMYSGLTTSSPKFLNYYVRAVSVVNFEVGSATANAMASTVQVSNPSGKTYKVGDYYNENGKEGVVFQVWDGGKHGKIVSLTEAPSKFKWSSDEFEQRRLIGASDEYNGANNMAKVKQIPDWESKYPAFKRCADLGEGWYLPAIEELKLFTLNTSVHDAVNQTLASKGVKLANKRYYHWYWSSTEYNYQSSSGEVCAWHVNMYGGNTSYYLKYDSYYVRAVSAF